MYLKDNLHPDYTVSLGRLPTLPFIRTEYVQVLGLYVLVREKQPHSSAVKHVTGRLIRVSKQPDCSSKAARYLITRYKKSYDFLISNLSNCLSEIEYPGGKSGLFSTNYVLTTLLVIFDGSTNTNTSNSVTFGTST